MGLEFLSVLLNLWSEAKRAIDRGCLALGLIKLSESKDSDPKTRISLNYV